MGMERRTRQRCKYDIDLKYSEALAETKPQPAWRLMQRAVLARWAVMIVKVAEFSEVLNEPAEFEERRVEMIHMRNVFTSACDEVEAKPGNKLNQNKQPSSIHRTGLEAKS